MKHAKYIIFLFFFIGLINGCRNYEDFKITGNWQFHDKDNKYYEIYITSDSMYCESTDILYWESEYYIEDNKLFFDSKTGYESATKNRIKIYNDTCFRIGLRYTLLYSSGESTHTIIDEMDIKLYRIDSNEFTLEKLMELTYPDSTSRSQKFKDYQFFLEQSQKRKWIYMDKIFDNN